MRELTSLLRQNKADNNKTKKTNWTLTAPPLPQPRLPRCHSLSPRLMSPLPFSAAGRWRGCYWQVQSWCHPMEDQSPMDPWLDCAISCRGSAVGSKMRGDQIGRGVGCVANDAESGSFVAAAHLPGRGHMFTFRHRRPRFSSTSRPPALTSVPCSSTLLTPHCQSRHQAA
jgi:hypothetical protein